MYTTVKYILDDAVKRHYGVIASTAVNMELLRGEIAAADELQAPLIILLGQGQMSKHGTSDMMVPMIKTLANKTNVPVALILDHGRDWEYIVHALRNGFSSVMIDASAYPMQENIERTKRVVDLSHLQGVAVEGEIGHVGQAADMDGCKEDLYTRPEDAAAFIKATQVDCLAIACGTAHGKYPDGFVPKLNFDIIREVRAITDIPLALHGGSGSGDDNIREAVAAGINKVNVCTDIFNYCRDFTKEALDGKADYDYLQLLIDIEAKAKEITKHYISLTGSEGKAVDFKMINTFNDTSIKKCVGVGE
jgi:fructose-bisphosphate aldolase class II